MDRESSPAPELLGAAGGTRETLLAAAEKLFAEHGIGASSVRAITQEAGANVAAVHYYFGSKEALVEAVYERRFGPLNRERLRRLEACEAAGGADSPPLRCLIEAFAAPAFEALADGSGAALAGLVGRALSEPRGEGLAVLQVAFREVAERFTAAFRRALPELPAEEVVWRFHFLVGSMAHTMQRGELAADLSGGVCRPGDAAAMLRRLTDFAEAGFRAPAGGSAGAAAGAAKGDRRGGRR